MPFTTIRLMAAGKPERSVKRSHCNQQQLQQGMYALTVACNLPIYNFTPKDYCHGNSITKYSTISVIQNVTPC